MAAAKKSNVVAIRRKPMSLGDIHDRLHDAHKVAISIEAAMVGVDDVCGGHNSDHGLLALIQLHQEQLQSIMGAIGETGRTADEKGGLERARPFDIKCTGEGELGYVVGGVR